MVDAARARFRSAPGRRAPCAGFTYLWVLLMVAVLGIGLAALGQVWTTAAQRDREKELLFIGEQFRRAIGSYYEGTPGPVKQYPARIEDLLEDRRFPIPQRHLRKRFRDPIRGASEWGLVLAANKTIMGIYSNARGSPLITAAPRSVTTGGPGYGAWQFIYTPGTDPVPVPLNAAGSGSGGSGMLPGAAPAASLVPMPNAPNRSNVPVKGTHTFFR